MKEKTLTEYIRNYCHDKGFLFKKNHATAYGNRNFPDATILATTNGLYSELLYCIPIAIFVEIKETGKYPRENQVILINELRQAKHFAFYCDSKESFHGGLSSIYSFLVYQNKDIFNELPERKP